MNNYCYLYNVRWQVAATTPESRIMYEYFESINTNNVLLGNYIAKTYSHNNNIGDSEESSANNRNKFSFHVQVSAGKLILMPHVITSPYVLCWCSLIKCVLIRVSQSPGYRGKALPVFLGLRNGEFLLAFSCDFAFFCFLFNWQWKLGKLFKFTLESSSNSLPFPASEILTLLHCKPTREDEADCSNGSSV